MSYIPLIVGALILLSLRLSVSFDDSVSDVSMLDDVLKILEPKSPSEEIIDKSNQDINVDFEADSEQYPGVNVTGTTASLNATKKLVACRRTLENSTLDERLAQTVELINVTRLAELLTPNAEVTNKDSEAQCMVVLFYSRLCPFSAIAGPHFNALARSYPDLKMAALDALEYHGVNTQYGIVGVPTLILFHNGRPVAKFNGSEYNVHTFVKFIKTSTGIQEDVILVHSQDFQGPVPSVTDKEIDYFLLLSWAFVIVCSVYFFTKTSWWKKLVSMVENVWREAEAQHEHAE